MWRGGFQYPNIIALVARSAEVGGILQRDTDKSLADVYVRPLLPQMGTLDTNAEHFETAVEAGYVAAREAIAAWRATRQES